MKTVGIICEYNPLHKGHAAQMTAVRRLMGEDTAIVCVMSGNFVQRGEPAVLDKYTRARGAVACGADLVLELPITGALSSAEGFCRAGVEVMDRLGVVDLLCFGSESGEGEHLLLAARTMALPEFEPRLRQELSAGISYGAAKQKVLEELTGICGIARTPNDILGVEYCRALLLRNSKIEPLPICRPGSYHDRIAHEENPSATAVRSLMDTEAWLDHVPQAARDIFAQADRYNIMSGQRAVLARLRAMDARQWEKTAHGSEGLWSKVMKAARRETGLQAVVEASVSKRYPRTRILRLMMCAYLGMTEEDLKRPISHTRVLAMSQTGRQLLKKSRQQGSIPILNAGERPEEDGLWEQERRYSDLYTLFCVEENHITPGMEKSVRVCFAEN